MKRKGILSGLLSFGFLLGLKAPETGETAIGAVLIGSYTKDCIIAILFILIFQWANPDDPLFFLFFCSEIDEDCFVTFNSVTDFLAFCSPPKS